MARFSSLTEWLKWQAGFPIDLGLERVTKVFKRLNPHAYKPPTIIVGGTNGKGSSIAFLEAIYRAQGYRVGAYSSPHLLHYNERIRIDGQAVSEHLICQAFERIDDARNEVPLSYFEFGTLAALDIFWRSELDVQLLEVGLGGRLDAINIIDADVTLITNISLDHTHWLGHTREQIGYEKAGIFRTHVTAIIGDDNPPDSLLQSAIEKNAPLLQINHDFTFEKTEQHWHWISYVDQDCEYRSLPKLGLKGEHQYGNAATVLMAITQMLDLLPVNETAIHQGLQTVQLKGRFQLVKTGQIPVLLDVAHNPQAVKMLLNYLVKQFSEKKIYAIFAIMKDKDITNVISIISPIIKHWFIAPLNNSRVASELLIQKSFRQCKLTNLSLGYQNFSEAYVAAEKKAKADDLILIFGSFFLVSEYLAKIANK